MGWMGNIDGCNIWGFLNWGSPPNHPFCGMMFQYKRSIFWASPCVTPHWKPPNIETTTLLINCCTAWVNNWNHQVFVHFPLPYFLCRMRTTRIFQEWPLAEKTQGTDTSYNAFNHLISQVCRSPWGAVIHELEWTEWFIPIPHIYIYIKNTLPPGCLMLAEVASLCPSERQRASWLGRGQFRGPEESTLEWSRREADFALAWDPTSINRYVICIYMYIFVNIA